MEEEGNKLSNKQENSYSSIKELEDRNHIQSQENQNLLKNEEKSEKEEKFNNNQNISFFQKEKISEPLKYGNNKILMYRDSEPFIVIGPHCKKKLKKY